MGNMKQN